MATPYGGGPQTAQPPPGRHQGNAQRAKQSGRASRGEEVDGPVHRVPIPQGDAAADRADRHGGDGEDGRHQHCRTTVTESPAKGCKDKQYQGVATIAQEPCPLIESVRRQQVTLVVVRTYAQLIRSAGDDIFLASILHEACCISTASRQERRQTDHYVDDIGQRIGKHEVQRHPHEQPVQRLVREVKALQQPTIWPCPG